MTHSEGANQIDRAMERRARVALDVVEQAVEHPAAGRGDR